MDVNTYKHASTEVERKRNIDREKESDRMKLWYPSLWYPFTVHAIYGSLEYEKRGPAQEQTVQIKSHVNDLTETECM